MPETIHTDQKKGPQAVAEGESLQRTGKARRGLATVREDQCFPALKRGLNMGPGWLFKHLNGDEFLKGLLSFRL